MKFGILKIKWVIFFIYISGLSLHAQGLNQVELTQKRKEYYLSVLKNNKEIVSFIEGSLVENGLPKMMRNLSLIESGFNKDAVSTAKAGGIWQLMEAHANQYGLKSEDRFDVYRSTQTAIKSLRNLYEKYGNWITVVAAYNCGEGNIQKAMDRANSNRYGKFYVHLPSETIIHVQRFMEACTVTNEIDFLLADYQIKYQNEVPQRRETISVIKDPAFAECEINAAYNLDVIAQEMEIDLIDLIRWNPELNDKLYSEGVALLYLPVDFMPDFLMLKSQILNKSIQNKINYDEQKL